VTPPIPQVPRSPRSAPPTLSARIVHGAIVAGLLLFFVVAGAVGGRRTGAMTTQPDRKPLYLALFVVTAAMFGAATFFAGRLPPRGSGESADAWWRRHLPRVVLVWALVEGPALFGIVAYLLTHDFRTLIATLAGLALFLHFSPGRIAARP
jgi:F0F1-type ATP synthase membrane subunit c/vacuolar-type H+-ATPase subunit K